MKNRAKFFNKPRAEAEKAPVERHYIKLSGGSDDENSEGFPDEYFEDEDPRRDLDVDEIEAEIERKNRKDTLVQNLCFYSFLFVCVSAVLGFFVILGRLTAYPFIKKLMKDDFMG